MQLFWLLLCCTILQEAYYVNILFITLPHNIVGSVLCRYLGDYLAAQYCRQSTLQISQSLLFCTILWAAYYVDIFVITLLHNIIGSIQCRYVGRYFAAQYCRHSTMQISQSLLCCTILQAAYYVDILVVTLLHNTVDHELCRYLGHYFAALYCRQSTRQISCQQRNMQISWSLLCCTILQAAYYVDNFVITLLQNTVAAYYVDILVFTLLHYIVGSVLCRYVGRYFAAQYCRQHTMQIYLSLLCCTILQAAYYVDILVFNLLHNTVGSVLCRYLGRFFSAQYCRQRTMQIIWSLLCFTILQAAYYVDILITAYYVYTCILVVTLLHNTVGRVLCRYLGHYFAAK